MFDFPPEPARAKCRLKVLMSFSSFWRTGHVQHEEMLRTDSFRPKPLAQMAACCAAVLHETETVAVGKGESVEAAVRAGRKESRDAHSGSLPVLRVAAPQGW